MQKAKLLPEENTPFDIGQVVQVACLAHDLGNPPFGHTGESALKEWFYQPENQCYLEKLSNQQKQDIQNYEGNAHSLRIVSNLEMYHNQGGMRLSAASIGTLLKYPWTSDRASTYKNKFNVYQTELPFIQAIAQELGLIQKADNYWARHPLSYLMEAADDICYAILDLEDAVEIGLIEDIELEKILSPIGAIERANHAPTIRQRCAILRGVAIGKCIEEVVQQFLNYQQDLLAGNLPQKDLISLCNTEVKETLEAAKALAFYRIYRHKTKLVTEIAAFPCLGAILDLLIPAVFHKIQQTQLSTRHQLALELLKESPITDSDTLYLAYMKVLDFVGTMTDNAAARLAREISGIGIL